MNKHTAGPWHASGNGIHTETGSCVALTHREPKEQRQIDARLIAAAPELLEALKGLRRRYTILFNLYAGPTYHESSKPGDDLELALADSDAAIAKAEGAQ